MKDNKELHTVVIETEVVVLAKDQEESENFVRENFTKVMLELSPEDCCISGERIGIIIPENWENKKPLNYDGEESVNDLFGKDEEIQKKFKSRQEEKEKFKNKENKE